MNQVIVHQVDITHYRLIELSTLADQAKPFYDWVEKKAKIVTGSHKELNEILLAVTRDELLSILHICYEESEEKRPFLFDGIGRVYGHKKACFYFFSWLIRDAPKQRLEPLIKEMRKLEKVEKVAAETDTLVELILAYRSVVRSFSWLVVREVVIDRLEGSRRSIKGHHVEACVRTALVIAFQNYFSIHGNYGQYKKIAVADKQIKIENHTFDVSAKLTDYNNLTKTILIPIKTRETEGGGHSHLFSRDITVAIDQLNSNFEQEKYHVLAVIIARNWSESELNSISDKIDKVFYFNMNPQSFMAFDESSQLELNKYIQRILDHV